MPETNVQHRNHVCRNTFEGQQQNRIKPNKRSNNTRCSLGYAAPTGPQKLPLKTDTRNRNCGCFLSRRSPWTALPLVNPPNQAKETRVTQWHCTVTDATRALAQETGT